jgi:hypothetical protein
MMDPARIHAKQLQDLGARSIGHRAFRMLLKTSLPGRGIRENALARWGQRDFIGQTLRRQMEELFWHVSRCELAASAGFVAVPIAEQLARNGLDLLGNAEVERYFRSSNRSPVLSRLMQRLLAWVDAPATSRDSQRQTARCPARLCAAVVSFDDALRTSRSMRRLLARVEEIALLEASDRDFRLELLGEVIHTRCQELIRDGMPDHGLDVADDVGALFELVSVLEDLQSLLAECERFNLRERVLDHYAHLCRFLGPDLYRLIAHAQRALLTEAPQLSRMLRLPSSEVLMTCKHLDRVARMTLLSEAVAILPPEDPPPAALGLSAPM